MFSHSNAQSVYNHPRNVPDDVLDMVPTNGGIVMVTFVPRFLAKRTVESSVKDVVDHIFYIANRIGWDHVGIGSDFDGIPSVVPGLEDVSKYPKLLEVGNLGVLPAYMPQTVPLSSLALAFILHTDSEIFHRQCWNAEPLKSSSLSSVERT